MPFDDSQPLVIGCDARTDNPQRDVHALIELHFGKVEADHVQFGVRLTIELSEYEGWSNYYWWNVQAFADGLSKMHSELKGSSTLSDWDSDTVLCMSVVDPVHGRIAIGGQLIQCVFWNEEVSEANLLSPRLYGNHGGIVVSFEGLVTDQSYLPPFISGLRCFLNDSGIVHRPPWP